MMSLGTRVIKITVYLLFGLILCSCSENRKDLYKYIHSVKATMPQGTLLIPADATVPVFKFPEKDTRRSPFQSIVPGRPDNYSGLFVRRIRQTLEAFSTKTLKFVGTLKQGSEVWALIKKPNQQVIQVKEGDCIGKNQGCVQSITDTRLTLDEVIKNSRNRERKITVLKMEGQS